MSQLLMALKTLLWKLDRKSEHRDGWMDDWLDNGWMDA